jgi:hypothetical protein
LNTSATADRAPHEPGIDRAALIAGAALTAALIAATALALSTTLNHDSAWYLQATRRLLDGARLYEDIVEVNPPLAFLLAVPPVWLAQLIGVSPIAPFFLWVFALAGAALVLVHKVLRAQPGISAGERLALMIAALLALTLGGWQEIGQREHFLLIFATPYLMLASLRAAGGGVDRRLALAIGAFAAFGFALKPHFLLVVAVSELWLVLKARRLTALRRPELAALMMLLAAYWAAVALFAPAYFGRIVPWALTVYGSYSASLEQVFWHTETLLLALALTVHLSFRRPSPLRQMAGIFLAAAVCLWLVDIVQSKDFIYHRIPVRGALIVTLTACLLASLQGAREGTGRTIRRCWRRPALALLALVATLGWLADQGSYRNRFLEHALPLVRAQGGARTLYVFSSNVWQAFPLANYAGLRSVSRYPTLWLLPGARAGGPASLSGQAERRAIARYVAASVLEDFRRRSPDLVLVDTRRRKPHFGGRRFDYIAYFSHDPRFARIWARYEPVARVRGFIIYRRRPRAR